MRTSFIQITLLCLILLVLPGCQPVTPEPLAVPSATTTSTEPATATATATQIRTPRPFIAPTFPPTKTYQPFPTPIPGPTVTPSGEWNLVWSDEFDAANGLPPDSEKWGYDVGGHGWGNNELEYYTDRVENAYHQDGSLIIEARKEDFDGSHYTSARIVTKNKGDWAYGRFEILAKLPKGQGIWPAFWLLPTDNVYGGWPVSGEVDIMELIGTDPFTIFGTLHWGAPHDSNGTSYTLKTNENFSDAYHLFALEWEPGEFRWYVDGYHYHTVTEWTTSGPNGAFPAPFDQRFHLLMNVAVGGNWPGSPDSTTQFPAKMFVDYVRVYQR